jgi:hypothetical protein
MASNPDDVQRDALPIPDKHIDDAAEDLDHLISPEELLRVAMSRQ